MGSPTQDFVLGFSPLQVAPAPDRRRRRLRAGDRRRADPAPAPHRLRRHHRHDVARPTSLPLEESQGTRNAAQRRDELTPGYMVGNCAHCHNPRGFPSVTQARAQDCSTSCPAPTDGGIFEFPLERESPIRARGATRTSRSRTSRRRCATTRSRTSPDRIDNGNSRPSSTRPTGRRGHPSTIRREHRRLLRRPSETRVARLLRQPHERATRSCAAPWRSLIYRNVDTPFPYFDDYVPFPHMPMNTSGFDCRAPRIMGDWMVGCRGAQDPETFVEDALPKSIAGHKLQGEGLPADLRLPAPSHTSRSRRTIPLMRLRSPAPRSASTNTTPAFATTTARRC